MKICHFRNHYEASKSFDSFLNACFHLKTCANLCAQQQYLLWSRLKIVEIWNCRICEQCVLFYLFSWPARTWWWRTWKDFASRSNGRKASLKLRRILHCNECARLCVSHWVLAVCPCRHSIQSNLLENFFDLRLVSCDFFPMTYELPVRRNPIDPMIFLTYKCVLFDSEFLQISTFEPHHHMLAYSPRARVSSLSCSLSTTFLWRNSKRIQDKPGSWSQLPRLRAKASFSFDDSRTSLIGKRWHSHVCSFEQLKHCWFVLCVDIRCTCEVSSQTPITCRTVRGQRPPPLFFTQHTVFPLWTGLCKETFDNFPTKKKISMKTHCSLSYRENTRRNQTPTKRLPKRTLFSAT